MNADPRVRVAPSVGDRPRTAAKSLVVVPGGALVLRGRALAGAPAHCVGTPDDSRETA